MSDIATYIVSIVTFHAIIFESQTLRVKKCWPKTDFDMK